MRRGRLAVASLTLALSACGDARPAAATDEAPLMAAGGRETFATRSHTCALVNGGVQCWGAADRGQTGDRSLALERPLPVRVAGLDDVGAVAAGGSHTCVLRLGKVWCFGDNAEGQAGAERPFVWIDPAPVEGLPSPATAIAAGLEHTCAVADGRVFCWGRNESGESGAPPPPDCRKPYRRKRCSVGVTAVPGIVGPPRAPRALALGDRHSCALVGSEVWCWGRGAQARKIRDLPGPANGLAAGADHTCTLVGREAYCWGADADRAEPLASPGGLYRIAAGGSRTCAASETGVWCWASRDAEARAVAGLTDPVSGLAVGLDHACARLGGLRDQILCWGENDAGQLGRGTSVEADDVAAPVAAWDDGRWRDAQPDGRITLVCLGDSNTQAMPGAEPPWCDRLPALLGDAVRVINRGRGGATALPSLLDAEVAVRHAVDHDDPDLAIVFYGTNDVLRRSAPDDVVQALGGHMRTLQAAGAEVWIALPPPLRSEDVTANRTVERLVAGIREAFPAGRLLDFHAGLGDAHLRDRVHLNAGAHARLAEIAAEAILPLRPPRTEPAR